MKILIQDSLSQKFLSRDGDWNTTPANAEDFGTPLSAIAAAKAVTNSNFRLVLYFPGKDGLPGFLLGAGTVGSRAVAPNDLDQSRCRAKGITQTGAEMYENPAR